MNQPAGGFNQPGLSALFRVPFHGGNANLTTSPSSLPPGSRPPGSRSKHRTVLVVGGLVGGLALMTLTASLGFIYRQRIRHFIIGGEWPFPEMDGDQKVQHEIMTRTIRWELPVEQTPAELWSPDSRGIKPLIMHPGDQGPGPRRLSPIVPDAKSLSLDPIELDARPPALRSADTTDITKPLPPSPRSSDRDSNTRSPSLNEPENKSPSLKTTSKNAMSPPSLGPPEGCARTLRRSPTIRRPKPLELTSMDKPTLELR